MYVAFSYITEGKRRARRLVETHVELAGQGLTVFCVWDCACERLHIME